MTTLTDPLTFDTFRDRATAAGLSRHERVGFPDAYREGYEAAIWRDVPADSNFFRPF